MHKRDGSNVRLIPSAPIRGHARSTTEVAYGEKRHKTSLDVPELPAFVQKSSMAIIRIMRVAFSVIPSRTPTGATPIIFLTKSSAPKVSITDYQIGAL